jgi:hypothetical protein
VWTWTPAQPMPKAGISLIRRKTPVKHYVE